MRGVGVLTLLLATWVSGHPLCFFDERPTDYDEVLTFCPAAQAGACCNDLEEAAVVARFDAVGALTGDCIDLYTQVKYSSTAYDMDAVSCSVLLATLHVAPGCGSMDPSWFEEACYVLRSMRCCAAYCREADVF